MACRRFQSTIRLVSGILLMFDRALCFYNKSYNGYTFTLPDAVMNHSNSRLLELSFFEANRWCEANVAWSTLAAIPNKLVQRDITEFIESALQSNNHHLVRNRYNNFRLYGKYYVTNAWRWVNDRHTNTDMKIDERHENSKYSFFVRLDHKKNFNMYSDKPSTPGYFICEYPAGKSERCDLSLNGRCYQKKDNLPPNWLKWYEARNKCLDGGGDLASFDTLSHTDIDVSLRNLSLQSNADYWIGLQKNEWRWEDTASAVKFTNWREYHPSNYNLQCLCLTRSQWDWKECDCSAQYPFICMLNDMRYTTTTGTPPSNGMFSETSQLVIIAVSCAAIFVVIIIIAAALITKKRRGSAVSRPFVSRAAKSSGYESPKPAVTESSMDFPVYAEIQQPKADMTYASDTTYASVQMTAGNNQELPANNVVYAELDLTTRP